MDEAEQFAADYLKQHGLRVERFSKEELRVGKTPDYRVFRHAEFVAFCEAKHVQQDYWLDEQLREAQPSELVGGTRPDPTFNRLTAHIHKAAQQFTAVNPNHDYPNILVFANSERQCGYPDLLAVLTGNFYGETGVVEPIYEQYAKGRVMADKMSVDVFVWWDCWKRVARPKLHFQGVTSKHYAHVSGLLESDPEKHRHVGAL